MTSSKQQFINPGRAKRTTPPADSTPAELVERVRHTARTALEELKGVDIVEIDVRGKTSMTDWLLIASGTSTRHVKALADDVVRAAKNAGIGVIGVEGEGDAEWVLVDLGDVVVHIMLPRTREFYGLERLWTVGDGEDADADAPRTN